ncbi:hypothetical protein, partial [Klebsiella quasipneumoniae]|uniref:hypothetical protein n=1 Tax=Klebsiella quasipneumoniae TaxID=1463165 RepID=UPI001C12B3DE
RFFCGYLDLQIEMIIIVVPNIIYNNEHTMNTSRFAFCALAGAVALALQGPAFAEESTIVVTGTEEGSSLPAWTNSATKSA